jgi:hypothetical protein
LLAFWKRALHLDQFGQFQNLREENHAGVGTAHSLHLVYAANVVNAVLARYYVVLDFFRDLLLFLFSQPNSFSYSTLLCMLGFLIDATTAKHSASC